MQALTPVLAVVATMIAGGIALRDPRQGPGRGDPDDLRGSAVGDPYSRNGDS
jgi:hypothetical protein